MTTKIGCKDEHNEEICQMKGGCTRHLFRGQNVSGCLSKVSTHQLPKFSFSKSFGTTKKDKVV